MRSLHVREHKMMRHVQRGGLVFGVIVTALTLTPRIRVSAQNKSDRERDNLIGPVQTALLETAPITCGAGECVEGRRAVLSRDEYDLSGRVVGDRNRFTINDPRTRMLFYPFDQSIPRIESPVNGENGIHLYTDVYTYDNKDRRAEHVNYDAGGVARYRTLIAFDEHGRLVEENHYDGKGTLQAWTRLTRDVRGNVVVAEEGEGAFYRKIVSAYEFDQVGNWIKATQSRSVSKGGRDTPEPYGVKYRTITYYERRA